MSLFSVAHCSMVSHYNTIINIYFNDKEPIVFSISYSNQDFTYTSRTFLIRKICRINIENVEIKSINEKYL